MNSEFSKNVIFILKNIPYGRVITYGAAAALAGNPRAARQVSWLLHSSSKKFNLPWHRVISSSGKISLPPPYDEEQITLLNAEGIEFIGKKVDLSKYFWNIKSIDAINNSQNTV